MAQSPQRSVLDLQALEACLANFRRQDLAMAAVRKLLETPNVTRLAAFGSAITHRARDTSDLDLLVVWRGYGWHRFADQIVAEFGPWLSLHRWVDHTPLRMLAHAIEIRPD